MPLFSDARITANHLVKVITFLCFFSFGTCQYLFAQPQMLYATHVARGASDDEVGYSIARDSSGNTYVTGRFKGTTDFDPGPGTYNMTSNPGFPSDIFVVKLDTNQNLLWAKTIGSTDEEFPYSIHVDAGGYAYIYGHFDGTVDFDPGPGVFNLSTILYSIFIWKLDSNGNFVWAKQLSGAQGWGMCAAMDEQGNLYASGYVNGGVDADPGPGTLPIGASMSSSIFVAKYDTAGNVLWAKSWGSSMNAWGYSVAVDKNGFVYTTGMFQSTVDFDPGPGTYNITATGSSDIFVSKLSPTGNFVWAKAMQGGPYFNTGFCVKADDNGNVYFTGEMRGTTDFDPGPGVYNLTSYNTTADDAFLAKLDPAGNLLWAFTMGDVDNETGYSLDLDSANHVIVTGIQQSDNTDYDPTSGSYILGSTGTVQKFFLVKYTSAGAVECGFLIHYATLGKTMLSQHLIVEDETAYLTGGFKNTDDFNPCPAVYNLSSAGDYDVFVAAYDFSTCDCAMHLASFSSNIPCYGACNGTASVTPQGGAAPYSYSWTPSGGNNSSAYNLCAGSYTCTVVDALGDTVRTTIAITEPPQLSSSISGTDMQCNATCNGTAQVNVSGGSPGYTYSWSNSQTTSSISSLCAGSYSVLITDNNGCTNTQNIAVAQPAALLATITATSTPCNATTGAVSANASGGTGNLNYAWQPGGDTTASISSLSPGIYSVTITDANGCTVTLSDTVHSIGAPIISTTNVTDILCNGDSTGSAGIAASGNGPFTYQWSPSGGTAATASSLTAGNYLVTVTDNAGCTQTQTIAITEPNAISATIVAVDDACTAAVGSVSLSPSGGVGPYTYNWSNSQSTASISNLSGGTYSVVITDANGCTFDTAATIISTVAPSLAFTALNNVACYGDSTGSATVSPSGGVGPYAYSWLPFGGSTATATGISVGTYTVTVSSSDGCTSISTISITQPPAISMNCGAMDENCNYQDGIAYAQASGGAGGFTYAWSNASAADTLFGLSAGTYSVTITDQNGCVETCAVVVNTTATAAADAGIDVTIEEGQSTALSGSGGVIYSWQPADDVSCSTCATTITTPSVTTTFVLTVTDSAGCVDMDTIVVTVEIPCDDIFVPNAFSPNGDGQNDVLFVRGTCIQSFTFSVFNRWGELVFKCSDQTIGWDGTWRGEACENAVFTYTVTGVLTDGDLFEKKGNVSVVR